MVEKTEPQRLLSQIVESIVSSGVRFTDIHIESGMEVMIRRSGYEWVHAQINGHNVTVGHLQILAFINAIFTGNERAPANEERPKWRELLQEKGSLHPAVNLSKVVDDKMVSFRMRCTVQKQMMGESIGLMLRAIPEVPTSLQSLGLPIYADKMLKESYRGLIIITGPTGSGKSTTLAAMIGEINRHRHANIITIEDPVEYVHTRDKCIINQREIGMDVNSFADGVHDALRFVPDVILIGEIRDAETMRQALRATESGCLVLASMHASTPISAIRKMLSYLSDSQRDMQTLAYLLVSVIAQALVRGAKGSGKNHLASAYLDCTNDLVVEAIIESTMSDMSHQKLVQLEKRIISGEVDCGASMLHSLKNLITSGAIDAKSAVVVVATNDEKEKIRKIVGK